MDRNDYGADLALTRGIREKIAEPCTVRPPKGGGSETWEIIQKIFGEENY